jgi:hypothetical protein
MMFFAFSLGMVLSNLLSQSKVELSEPVVDILFTYKGVDKTLENLSAEKREQLQQLAAERYAILEYAALEQYLQDYAAAEKLEIEQAGKQLFKLKEPTKQEVNDFYTQHADEIKKPFFEVQLQIKKQLIFEAAKKAKNESIKRLISKGDLVILPEY